MKSRGLVMVPCKKKLFVFFAVFCFFLLFIKIEGAAGFQNPFSASGATAVTKKSCPYGHPISMANGAYYFSRPLLSLGGLMDLRFELLYRSDYPRFSYQFLPPTFWWSPFAEARLGEMVETTEYGTVYLPNGDNVSFKKDASGNWTLTDPTVNLEWLTVVDNRPQTKYVLKETTGFAYLMDPIDERVYIFEKFLTWSDGTRNYRIVRVLDRNGNQLIYTHQDSEFGKSNLVLKVEDGLGRSLNFVYGPVGNWNYLQTITDQTGQRQVKLNYEAAGSDNYNDVTLRRVDDPMDQRTTFQYAGRVMLNNLIAGETRPLGNTPFTQAYDDLKFGNEFFPRVISQTDEDGNTINLTYTSPNDSITVTRPDGTQVKFEHYSALGLPKSITDAAGKTAQFTKDSDEHIISVTNRMGDTTNSTFHAETGKLASLTNAKGNTINYTYTAQDQSLINPLLPSEQVPFRFYNLTRIDHPDGTYEEFTHDAKGNILTWKDRAGHIRTYTHNSRGQVLTLTNPAGGVMTFTYNGDATLASRSDSDRGVTTYVYDSFKRLTRINLPDGTNRLISYNINDSVTGVTDENGHTYSISYDANGNLIQITDPAGKINQYNFDLLDRLVKFTDRLGHESSLSYNASGRLTSIINPNGNTTQLGYNQNGRLTNVTDGAGQIWQAGYDAEGRLVSNTVPTGQTTSYQVDVLGRPTKITDSSGNQTNFSWDSMFRLTSIDEPLNRQTLFGYEARGLLASITKPVVGTASITRNGLGFISQITDLNGKPWIFDHTSMGRRSSRTDPLGNQWGYSYDPRGRLLTITYPDGDTNTFTHDGARNVTRRHYSNGPDLQFTYDALDRVISGDDITLNYDPMGRITATQTNGISMGGAYDAVGRLTQATYNNGAISVTYTYDAVGRLTQVNDSLTGTHLDFSYDATGRILGINRSNGITTTFTYDAAGQINRIQDGALADQKLTLNALGEVVQVIQTLPLDPSSEIGIGTDSFTYDDASQVSSAGYAYDKRGRQTTSPGHTFTWDGANRLIGTGEAVLDYNGLDDVIRRTVGGTATHYHYNYALLLSPIVAEQDEATGQFRRYYIWAPTGILLYLIDLLDGNKVYFYHLDPVGSTLFLTDASGVVTDSYAYASYGMLLAHEGTSTQPFTYIGGFGVRQEGGNGLYQMRARYYDAVTARFLSRDPSWPIVGFDTSGPLALNPYVYAFLNPVNFLDPLGKESIFQKIWSGYQDWAGEQFFASTVEKSKMQQAEAEFFGPAALKPSTQLCEQAAKNPELAKMISENKDPCEYAEEHLDVYDDPNKALKRAGEKLKEQVKENPAKFAKILIEQTPYGKVAKAVTDPVITVIDKASGEKDGVEEYLEEEQKKEEEERRLEKYYQEQAKYLKELEEKKREERQGLME